LDGEVEALKNHLSEMQQSFQDYLPKEAKKIDDAVILQWGRYVVACVSGDKDNAKKVLTEQMEGTD
jgi:2-C-methyl-D-erythritol 4-phosphate cytidylyltransferase